MDHITPSRLLVAVSVGIGFCAIAIAPALQAAPASAAAANKTYIIQMADMPVTAYTGTIQGYAATKPRKGQKIDPLGNAVINYKASCLAARYAL